jgi:hypothetical protein
MQTRLNCSSGRQWCNNRLCVANLRHGGIHASASIYGSRYTTPELPHLTHSLRAQSVKWQLHVRSIGNAASQCRPGPHRRSSSRQPCMPRASAQSAPTINIFSALAVSPRRDIAGEDTTSKRMRLKFMKLQYVARSVGSLPPSKTIWFTHWQT